MMTDAYCTKNYLFHCYITGAPAYSHDFTTFADIALQLC